MTPFGWLCTVLVVIAAGICELVLASDHSLWHVVLVGLAAFAIAIGAAIEIDRIVYRLRRRRAVRRHPLLTGGTR